MENRRNILPPEIITFATSLFTLYNGILFLLTRPESLTLPKHTESSSQIIRRRIPLADESSSIFLGQALMIPFALAEKYLSQNRYHTQRKIIHLVGLVTVVCASGLVESQISPNPEALKEIFCSIAGAEITRQLILS